MNSIERLRNLLEERFPDAKLSIDKPDLPSGNWFLDIGLKGHSVVIEWRPTLGFGISTPTEDDFGAGPDEVYEDLDPAFARVKELLLSQTRTQAPRELQLPRIRESRNLLQVELARRLEITQASLSKMERRSDMLLGTLRNIVNAMGGQLEVRAVFPDEVIRIQLDEMHEQPEHSHKA